MENTKFVLEIDSVNIAPKNRTTEAKLCKKKEKKRKELTADSAKTCVKF
jgi:hypothetical protein